MKHLNFKTAYGTEDVCSVDTLPIKASVKRMLSARTSSWYYRLYITQKLENQPKKSFRLKQQFPNITAALDFFMEYVYESIDDTPIDLDALRVDLQFLKLCHGNTQQTKLACKQFLLLAAFSTNTELFKLELGSLPWCLAVFRDEGMTQSQGLAFIRIVQAARSFIATNGELDCNGFLNSISDSVDRLLSVYAPIITDAKTLVTKNGVDWLPSKNEYDPFHSPTWNIKGCKYIKLDSIWWLEETFRTKSFELRQSSSPDLTHNAHGVFQLTSAMRSVWGTSRDLKSFNRQQPTSQGGPLDPFGIHHAKKEYKHTVNIKEDDLKKEPQPDYSKSPELRSSDATWYSTDMQSGIMEINDPCYRTERVLIIPGERVTKGVTLHAMWYVLCIFPAEGGDAIFKFASDVNDAMHTYNTLRPRPVKKEIPQPIQAYSVVTLSSVIVQNARDFLTALTETMKYSEVKSSTDSFLKAVNHVLRTHAALTLDQDRVWLTIAMKCGVDFKNVLSHAVQLCNTIAETENNLALKKQELFSCLAHLIALKPVV